MSLRMRQATMGGGFVVTRWCGGIRLTPGSAPEDMLGSEPIYLDWQDLVRLLVFAEGEDSAADVLDPQQARWAAEWLARQPDGTEPFYAVDAHQAVVDYWDRQP